MQSDAATLDTRDAPPSMRPEVPAPGQGGSGANDYGLQIPLPPGSAGVNAPLTPPPTPDRTPAIFSPNQYRAI